MKFPFSDSLQKWRNQNRTAIWLQVPLQHSRHIAVAAQYGFLFHNAEHKQCLLKLWLPKGVPDTTPRFATHQLGVCGKCDLNIQIDCHYQNLGIFTAAGVKFMCSSPIKSLRTSP